MNTRRLAGVVGEAQRLWRQPSVRIGVAVLSFAAVTHVTVLIARLQLFIVLRNYDDEGYMLYSLKSFLEHGSLYDRVFSRYGPFYYEAWGGLFSALGIPVNHDTGRTATWVVWVVSSLGIGVATLRMTRSIVLGVAVQMMVFRALVSLTDEPMHPGGLICLLLVTISSLSCFAQTGRSIRSMALLGGAVAALILVKINVGGFALVALALTCVASYSALASRRWLRLVVEAVFVATPVVLMMGTFGEAWARLYAAHVTTAALAVVITLRAHSVDRRPTEELWWIGGGLLGVALSICLAMIGAGTTLATLFDGVIWGPLHQVGRFTGPTGIPGRAYVFDAIALAGAIGYWYVARNRRAEPQPAWVSIASALSIVIGVEMALSVFGWTLPHDSVARAEHPFSLLALTWVALPMPRVSDPATEFARLLLPPLAVLQALHAFPVAGSQLSWSTFLLIPAGAICVAKGVRGLALGLHHHLVRRSVAAMGVVIAFVVLRFVVDATLREPLRRNREDFDTRISLGLPGATLLHLPPSQVRLFRAITAAINAYCGSFVTLPDMDSFYLWTGHQPPAGYNSRTWTILLDDAQQQQMIDDTRSVEDLCLLRNIPLAEWWTRGAIPAGPLVRYLEEGFQPIVKFGDYELLKRNGPGPAH